VSRGLDLAEAALRASGGDDAEVVVRIQATPVSEADGPHLATEVLEAVARETRRGEDGVTPAAVAAR